MFKIRNSISSPSISNSTIFNNSKTYSKNNLKFAEAKNSKTRLSTISNQIFSLKSLLDSQKKYSGNKNQQKLKDSLPDEDEIEKCIKNDLLEKKEECTISSLSWNGYVTKERNNFQIFGIDGIDDYDFTNKKQLNKRLLTTGIRLGTKKDLHVEITDSQTLNIINNSSKNKAEIITRDFKDVEIPDGCQYFKIDGNQNFTHFLGCFTAISPNYPNSNFFLISHKIHNLNNSLADYNIQFLNHNNIPSRAVISNVSDRIYFYKEDANEFKISEIINYKTNLNEVSIIDRGTYKNKKQACIENLRPPQEFRTISESYKDSESSCIDFDNDNPFKSKINKGPDKDWLEWRYFITILPSVIGLTICCIGCKNTTQQRAQSSGQQRQTLDRQMEMIGNFLNNINDQNPNESGESEEAIEAINRIRDQYSQLGNTGTNNEQIYSQIISQMGLVRSNVNNIIQSEQNNQLNDNELSEEIQSNNSNHSNYSINNQRSHIEISSRPEISNLVTSNNINSIIEDNQESSPTVINSSLIITSNNYDISEISEENEIAELPNSTMRPTISFGTVFDNGRSALV